ncbi:MAG: efflux RND transporter periplasmic adaptor subunit [Proteobacteria bacterium]|nr:efflux RND transporter periplasmic adaptor subunit [Pseudomonadota bacterium]
MRRFVRRFLVVPVASLALSACGGGGAPQQQGGAMPPPEVGVVTVNAISAPMARELVGRLYPTRSADVRARVAGVLQKRVYTEGSDVAAGQLLFRIDPAPLKAALDAQQANLAAAQATAANDHVAAERARAIAAKNLISKTDLDNAQAAERTSAAAVKQAQANVELARINLGYADVTAPIAGRASQQQVTEGALVGQGDATLLTTVQQIDPIYVYFQDAVGDLQALRGSTASSAASKANLELLGDDGASMGVQGTLDFSDKAVDPATGAVEMRGILPNPGHALLPGMFVRVRATFGQRSGVFRVPQAAVQRDADGPFVFVVGSDGKAVQKRVELGAQQGSDWMVNTGLANGDRVIVSGVQRVQPGAAVKASPWSPAAAGPASQAH